MTNQYVVSAENVGKSFSGVSVLNDITVQVKKGESVAIIGPSGSGKSTLLRCMTFLETMEFGSLSYGGLSPVIASADKKSSYASKALVNQAKSRFGLVFQNFNLFPHYSVLKNIMDAPICVQKRNADEVRTEALALLKKMGLSGKEDSVPCELSGGQRQRVAIARALACKPDVIFFDEPTSALDPELTQEVLKVIRDLASEHMTMVIVTHEMAFAREVANRVIFMEGGYIVEEGPARDVLDNQQHHRTRAFIGA